MLRCDPEPEGHRGPVFAGLTEEKAGDVADHPWGDTDDRPATNLGNGGSLGRRESRSEPSTREPRASSGIPDRSAEREGKTARARQVDFIGGPDRNVVSSPTGDEG